MWSTPYSGVSDVPRQISVSDVPKQNTAFSAANHAEIAGNENSRYDLDAPVEDISVSGTQGLFDTARRVAQRDNLTLRDIGKWYAQGVLLPQFVGTAKQVADQIEESFTAGEADGFMVSAAQSPGTFNDFVDSVVPELQRRRLFREEYTGTTLRDHLGLPAARFESPRRRSVSVAS